MFIILLLIIPFSIFAQFKKYTIDTDSSKLNIIINSAYVINEEKFNITGLIHERTFYVEDSTLYVDGWKDSTHKYFGAWEYYKPNGHWLKTVDYSKGSWEYDKLSYPYISILDSMIQIGNNLIKSIYSNEFFDEHVFFDCVESALYGEKEKYLGRWTDTVIIKPNAFDLSYKIRLDSEHVYEKALQFRLDSLGMYIPEDYFNFGPPLPTGFENVKTENKNFTLTYESAIKNAKLAGLVETDSFKVEAFLRFERDLVIGFFDGKYRFNVLIQTGQIKKLVPEGRSSIISKYDMYSFNPWTSELAEKKKMKSVYEWEKNSGSSYGLEPDD